MNIILSLTFLFAVGGMLGWGIEVIYRRYVSQKHWVNPGFLTGPCLPLYGFSLCILYLLARLEDRIPVQTEWLAKLILFVLMAIAITALEYLVGIIMISYAHVRLWDYSECKGNIQGIICPQYSFYWMILSALYYFFVHPHILDAIDWLSHNLAFSFGIGFFYGILVIDIAYSGQIIYKIRKFADENQIVVRLEALRDQVHDSFQQRKPRFLLSMKSEQPLHELLEQYRDNLADRKKKLQERRHSDV